jgi:polyisoprenoid-binding protein YceI
MTQLMTEQGIIKVPAGTWKVDQSHSSVAFEVKHMMISTVRGLLAEYDGTLEAQDDPEQSTVTGWAAAASIDTGNEDRDAHLRGPDFFDAERYPRLSFVSTAIRHLEGGTYAVTGDLTIKDVTREITVEATVQGTGEDPWGNQRAGIAVRGSIDRTAFGLTWQSRLAGGGLLVGEEVNLLLDVSAVASKTEVHSSQAENGQGTAESAQEEPVA